jgi:hypothetical protein
MDSNRPVMGERGWDQGRQSAVALNRWGEVLGLKFQGAFFATLIAVASGNVHFGGESIKRTCLRGKGRQGCECLQQRRRAGGRRSDGVAESIQERMPGRRAAPRVGLNVRCSRGARGAGGRGGGL